MKRRTILLNHLLLLALLFIWGNSVLPKEVSASISHRLLSKILSFLPSSGGGGVAPPWSSGALRPLPSSGGGGVPSDTPLRKLAHFTEYAFLGMLLAIKFRRETDRLLIPFALALSVAVIDETIQIFAHRGSSVFDVLLDACGAAVGIAVCYFILSKIKSKKAGK